MATGKRTIHQCKLAFAFSPEALKADLEKVLPNEWVSHFNKDYYDGDWSGVPLRAPDGAVGTLQATVFPSVEFADSPALQRCHYFQQVLSTFRCPIRSARLLRLQPGSIIKEHRDYDLGYEAGEVRIHIPILTNPQVEFILRNRRVILGEGEVWYLDLSWPHRVSNLGSAPRIHLVIDLMVNDWLREQIPFEKEAEDELPLLDLPSDKAAENLERFRDLVRGSLALQQLLRETSDRELFIDETLRAGREQGLDFNRKDIEYAIQTERRKWNERWIR